MIISPNWTKGLGHSDIRRPVGEKHAGNGAFRVLVKKARHLTDTEQHPRARNHAAARHVDVDQQLLRITPANAVVHAGQSCIKPRVHLGSDRG